MRRVGVRSELAVFAVAAMFVCSVHAAETSCPSNDSGLKLPAGFCATIFADKLGHARHLALGPGGVIYANTWSGRYYVDPTAPEGGFLVGMQDTDNDGKADVIERFGSTPKAGGKGGTGIGIYKDSLYAEIDDKIVRYPLPRNAIVPTGEPITVVKNLPLTGNHPAHPFLIDPKGNLYVTSASASNACQKEDRTLRSPGLDPCTELETRAGFWLYDARKTNQQFTPAERFATGNRNGMGFAIEPSGRIYVSQHGRDQIHANWPEVFQPEEEATLPAEEVMVLERGADYGWPMCYYDPRQKKRMLGPEYGGDGKREGICASKTPPVAHFPAHWAPNALLFYNGGKFPDRYRNGMFIAFHGSWNRAPYEQGGYNIAFQPMKNGRAAGRCEIFVDGFAGASKQPGSADHRPSGLLLDASGALLISDDIKGRIYRVTYHGPANADAAALGVSPCPAADAPAGPVVPMPEDDEKQSANVPVPQGFTAEAVELGRRIYHGQEVPATCVGCHGFNGAGTPLGPNLRDGEWLWSDGSVAGIARTIVQGVSAPKEYRSAMPAMGGVQLSQDQVNAVAAYLWGLSRPSSQRGNAGDILIPGERVFPESVTASADGRLFVGSLEARTIYSAAVGDKAAKPWVERGEETRSVLGVFADDRANTLWACYSPLLGPAQKATLQATLKAFDLTSGAAKGDYAMPTAGALCNDIAVSADGNVYVTDSNNMEIVRLDQRAKKLVVWAGNGAFGPKGGLLDGIAVLGDRVLVNTLITGRLFGVTIRDNGTAAKPVEIQLGRKLEQPDGMRSIEPDTLLVVEGGDADRLSSIVMTGNAGKVTAIKEGFANGPVSVAALGSKAWVVEGQLDLLFGKVQAGAVPQPFTIKAIGLPMR